MSDPRTALVTVALPSRKALKAFDRRRLVVATVVDAHAERPFWGPHPDPYLAAVESDFYHVGNDYLRHLYAAVLGKPVPHERSLRKAFHLDPGQVDGWGKLADLFKQDASVSHLLHGWDSLVQKLTTTLLPEQTIEAAAARLALRTNLMWALGQRAMNPPDLSWNEAQSILSLQRQESMAWAKVHGMAYLKGLSDESRKSLRLLLVESKESGEGTSGLQRRLFDKVSQLNRDWRRISLTETAIAATNGQLASAPAGVKMVARWVAGPLACKHCLGYQGAKFDVLHAPAPALGDTAVWPGKNNVGRSAYKWSQKERRFREKSEIYWPCQPLHPLCACSFVIQPAT